MTRALALARWPHTDAERVRFHDQYLFLIESGPGPGVMPRLLQVEVVTEFRRLELMAEAHKRLGDAFGRGGLDEVETALRPWRGLVAVAAHLQLPSCGDDRQAAMPATEISIAGVGSRAGQPAARSVLYARTGLSPVRLGSFAEAQFDAAAIGQTVREVRVVLEGRELAHVAVDFGTLR